MLRGMACGHQVESPPPSENQREGARAVSCETSRQILRDVISRRISDAVAFGAAVDRPLQQLALSQVTSQSVRYFAFTRSQLHDVPIALLVALFSLGLHSRPNLWHSKSAGMATKETLHLSL